MKETCLTIGGSRKGLEAFSTASHPSRVTGRFPIGNPSSCWALDYVTRPCMWGAQVTDRQLPLNVLCIKLYSAYYISCSGNQDANWASQEHRHSISGYVFTIGGGAVSWSSKKQPLVALSTTEAEYIAATHAAKEALWLRTFLAEITRPLIRPITIHLDNVSAISITKNNEYHPRTKHIDIRYHIICHAVQDNLIHVDYIPTDDMAAGAGAPGWE
jgi:hypothetical protein